MSLDSLMRQAATDPKVISIGGGLPSPALFPRQQLAGAFVEAMREPQCAALQYDWPEGQDSLRDWVVRRLRARGVELGRDDVLITAGAQQAMALAAQLLVRPGIRVGVEPETYPAALHLFRRRGATLVGCGEGPDCLYLVDGITNPRGQPLDAALRARVAAGGAPVPVPVIADEAYAELSFRGELPRPLVADARERVWHVGTLSKTLSPGLRLGWLVPPPVEVARAVELKETIDLQTASLSQVIAERFLLRHDYDEHVARARQFYERQARVLSAALRRELPDWRFVEPVGGFSIFAERDLPAESGDDPTIEEAWLRTAIEHGASFDPGSLFRHRRSPTPLAMRLCYSAAGPARLREAVRRLAAAWRLFRRDRPEIG